MEGLYSVHCPSEFRASVPTLTFVWMKVTCWHPDTPHLRSASRPGKAVEIPRASEWKTAYWGQSRPSLSWCLPPKCTQNGGDQCQWVKYCDPLSVETRLSQKQSPPWVLFLSTNVTHRHIVYILTLVHPLEGRNMGTLLWGLPFLHY